MDNPDEIKLTWQLITFVGSFIGALVALFIGLGRWFFIRTLKILDRLTDGFNEHAGILKVHEQRLNSQEKYIEGHDEDIDKLRERWIVNYKKN